MATTIVGSPGPWVFGNSYSNNDFQFDDLLEVPLLDFPLMTASKGAYGGAVDDTHLSSDPIWEEDIWSDTEPEPASAASNPAQSLEEQRQTLHLARDHSATSLANRAEVISCGGDSTSPGSNYATIITPTSTNDYALSNSARTDYGSELSGDISPTSTNNTDNDFILIDRASFPQSAPTTSRGSARQAAQMSNRPPQPSMNASGAPHSQSTSQGPQLPPSTMTWSGPVAQWGQMTDPTSVMDFEFFNQPDTSPSFSTNPSGSFNQPTSPPSSAPQYDSFSMRYDDLVHDNPNVHLPFRPSDGRQPAVQQPFTALSGHGQSYLPTQHQYMQQYNAPTGAFRQASYDMRQAGVPAPQSIQRGAARQQRPLSASPANLQLQTQSYPLNSGFEYSSLHPAQTLRHNSGTEQPLLPSKHTPSPPQSQHQKKPIPPQTQRPSQAGPIRQFHTIAQAPTNNTPYRPPRALPNERGKRGGRAKDSHLNVEAKKKAAEMRSLGTCWRCALQRDPVRPFKSS
jgi:hypothetical protein